MKIINFGSLNIDNVYNTRDFVKPGETIHALEYKTVAGGKGQNQSVAAARAGAQTVHAGCIGKEGIFMKELLDSAGVDTSRLCVLDAPSGHAIIEINGAGQNRIIVFGGTNQMYTREYIDSVAEIIEEGDIALFQNETNMIPEAMRAAVEKGARIAFNPSPIPENMGDFPLDEVEFFLVNEIEGAALSGQPEGTGFEDILKALSEKYPKAAVIMTLGSEGVLYKKGDVRESHPIFKVKAVDTTAAGDTFAGYFLSAMCHGRDVKSALKEASAASAIAVSKPGAVPSIPEYGDVLDFIAKNS